MWSCIITQIHYNAEMRFLQALQNLPPMAFAVLTVSFRKFRQKPKIEFVASSVNF